MPVLTDYHRGLIGRAGPSREIALAVNEAMARHWCEMVEDANPIYFDEAYARSTWLGGTFAPPSMLLTWSMRPVWPPSKEVSALDTLDLEGCDATIAVNAVQEYFEPLRYGDRLTTTQTVAAISEEKRTRLGVGHFVTIVMEFTNQLNVKVATHEFRLFVYKAHEGGEGR